MRRTRELILALIGVAAFLLASPAHAADPPPRSDPTQSLAIIFSRSVDGTSCGNGFFIGDDSLLVTARNVVFPKQFRGLHQGEAFVTVLSLHLGQAAEAQVLAEDRELDVVLLRLPWNGHPSLPLAAEADLIAAEAVEPLALTNEQSAVTAGQPGLLVSTPQATRVTLAINAVMVRRNATRTISTLSAPTGPGWTGAPMLLPGRDAVAGCYVRTQADGTAGVGVACGAIRRLVETAGVTDQRPAASLAPAPHAGDATLAYLRGISASAAGDFASALSHFQAFLELRPTSAVGYRDLAGQLRALDRMQEAQVKYAKALELQPALTSARVLYGQLLNERILPKAAEEHLLYAWEHGQGSTAAVLPLCNLLREQGREKECPPLLEKALGRRPMDGHLWSYLGQTKRTLADPAGAAAAFARAADLMGDRPALRLQSAEQFEAAGLRPRAEEQYRTLLAEHPDAATAHFHFARFIGRESTRRDEAIRHAQKALALADDDSPPPRAAIEALLKALRAGQTSPASELRL